MVKVKKKTISKGSMTSVQEEGKDILIVNLNGKYYALDNICPHLKCKLSKGKLDGKTVICPCHGSSFDVTDGKLVTWINDWPDIIGNITGKLGLSKDLETFDCSVEGDEIVVDTGEKPDISDKKRLVALIIAFLLGWFGGHRFYVNKFGTGLLMFFTMGGFGMWYIVDMVLITGGIFKDKEKKPLKKWL